MCLVASHRLTLLCSPLLCSAVDNILMKLAREEVPFVRLGRLTSVHPAVRPWTPGGERYPVKTTRQMARLADSVPVVSDSYWAEAYLCAKLMRPAWILVMMYLHLHRRLSDGPHCFMPFS
jgi:hypothetical protein